MRTARIIAAAAGLACAATAAQAFAQAAPGADDGDLYIFNMTARPVELIVDSAQVGELARMGIARRPVRAGGHGLAVVALGHVVSAWQDLDASNVTLNAPGRPAWCAAIVNGARPSDPVQLQLLDPHACRMVVHAGPALDASARR